MSNCWLKECGQEGNTIDPRMAAGESRKVILLVMRFKLIQPRC